MRRILYAAVVASIVASGCAAPPTDPTDTPWPAETVSLPGSLDLLDCFQVGVNLQVDPASIQARLPPGLTVEVSGHVPGAPYPGSVAILGVEAYDCQGSARAGTAAGPLQYARIWTRVVSPLPPTTPATVAYYNWDILMSNDTFRAWLDERMDGIHAGGIVTESVATPPGVTMRLELQDFGTITIGGTLDRPRPDFTYEYEEYFPGEPEGLFSWTAQLAATGFINGRGTVTFPSGSWPTEITGMATVPGTIWTSNVQVENITVRSQGP